jgi:hypothetical protein
MGYSHTFGGFDIGLPQFIGTNREATLLNGNDYNNNAIKKFSDMSTSNRLALMLPM